MKKMRMESNDGFEANIQKIAEMFPSCIKEGVNKSGKVIKGIDMEALSML